MPVANNEYNDNSQIKSYMNNVSGAKPNKLTALNNNDGSFIGLFFEDKLKSLKKQEEKALYEDDFDNLKKIRGMIGSIIKSCK